MTKMVFCCTKIETRQTALCTYDKASILAPFEVSEVPALYQLFEQDQVTQNEGQRLLEFS